MSVEFILLPASLLYFLSLSLSSSLSLILLVVFLLSQSLWHLHPFQSSFFLHHLYSPPFSSFPSFFISFPSFLFPFSHNSSQLHSSSHSFIHLHIHTHHHFILLPPSFFSHPNPFLSLPHSFLLSFPPSSYLSPLNSLSSFPHVVVSSLLTSLPSLFLHLPSPCLAFSCVRPKFISPFFLFFFHMFYCVYFSSSCVVKFFFMSGFLLSFIIILHAYFFIYI